jgi:hypothetical protein
MPDMNFASFPQTQVPQNSGLAGILGQVIGAVAQNQQNKHESAITTEKLKNDYAKMDYDKRKTLYDKGIEAISMIQDPAKQQEFTASPEWSELEKSLGMPSLSNQFLRKDSGTSGGPSYAQDQENQSIQDSIARGEGFVPGIMGMEDKVPLTNEQQIADFLAQRKRGQASFTKQPAKTDSSRSKTFKLLGVVK